MPELNVSVSGYFSTSGANNITTAQLTVMVSDESGAARGDLALADFTVQALQESTPVGVKVTFGNAPYVDPAFQQIIPPYPPGIFFLYVSKSDGTAFDINSPWTFIVHVYRQVYRLWFHTDYEGWAVAGVNYPSTPV
jgi:hypothetical protein